MVTGIESFREWFSEYEDQYVIIGGTACDILMAEEGMNFRATKDMDVVLIVENISTEFGRIFWEYIKMAGYVHRKSSTGKVQFYRFTHPCSSQYPAMIELFTRKPDNVVLPEDAGLTPLPIEEYVSSLSAILLDEAYYSLLKLGKHVADGVMVLDAAYLIPFKAKAWLDLNMRKENGEQIDSKNIRKHKNDIFRLTELIDPFEKISLPLEVQQDMKTFLGKMKSEEVQLKQLGITGRSKDEILEELSDIYQIKETSTGAPFYMSRQ